MKTKETSLKKIAVRADETPELEDPKITVHSMTGVYRKTASFKCNQYLWKTFRNVVKQQGTSICHILEALITAYVSLASSEVNFGNTVTIENLHVQRIVQKHRRVTHEYCREPNMYNAAGRWVFVADASLNEQGHALGCQCRVCMG